MTLNNFRYILCFFALLSPKNLAWRFPTWGKKEEVKKKKKPIETYYLFLGIAGGICIYQVFKKDIKGAFGFTPDDDDDPGDETNTTPTTHNVHHSLSIPKFDENEEEDNKPTGLTLKKTEDDPLRTIKEEDDEKASEDLYKSPKSKNLISPELVDMNSIDGNSPLDMKKIMSKEDLDTEGEDLPPRTNQPQLKPTDRHSILNLKYSETMPALDPNIKEFLALEEPNNTDSLLSYVGLH